MDFRFAVREDTALILRFIKALAAYEKMSGEVVADEKTLEEWLFDRRKAEVLFVLEGGEEVGFALFFHNFPPSWAGRAFTLRICMCARSSAAGAMGRPC